MSLTESIVEDAALSWFGELGYAVGHGPQMAPGEPAAKRKSFAEVVLVGRLRKAIPTPDLATWYDTLSRRHSRLSGESSAAPASATLRETV